MKSVMVIDDDDDVREVIVFALESDGIHVFSFSGGKEGLETLEKMPLSELPGLIIVDYLMPEMDGITFMKTLKTKHPETLGRIPLAISSAMGGMDSFIGAHKEVILLHKPMDLDELLSVVREKCQSEN